MLYLIVPFLSVCAQVVTNVRLIVVSVSYSVPVSANVIFVPHSFFFLGTILFFPPIILLYFVARAQNRAAKHAPKTKVSQGKHLQI